MQCCRHSVKVFLQISHEFLGIYDNSIRKQSASIVFNTFVLVSFLFVSCRQNTVGFSAEERRKADSIVSSVGDVDSLSSLQKTLATNGDWLGSIVALRVWGKTLRNESRFEEALRVHSEGMRQAETIGDTIEWVQALNNIGTDYRRLGVLDVAQEYHFRALMLSEESCDTSFVAKKNRVVSLNGLGNIYLTLGNYERADSLLRMALAGEQQLNSTVGQAINYANLGSICEHRGQKDSAWVCYHRSMMLNEETGNQLGISLCHTYFGSMYQKEGKYGKAIEEYETAYKMMKDSKDEWHSINALIALADINSDMGNGVKTLNYLDRAKKVAERIGSKEHLAEIYTLYYKYYKQVGDIRSTLSSYEKATAIRNSLLDMEKMNRIQNASLSIERNRQEREKNGMMLRLEQERTANKIGYIVFALVVLLLVGLVAMLLYVQRIRKRNHLALKRLSSMRENFFTNITHEFRTPLTVILGLSRELQSADAEDTINKAQTIERQGNGLLMLINQLLDISKIKSALGNSDWINANITAYVAMIVEAYRDYAHSRNIDLLFYGKDDIDMDFVPDYVKKVVDNLLSNAFKFTPEYGKISVSLQRSGKRLLIDVEDTGDGIDGETLVHMFDAFYQGAGDTRNIGTGVGLALVKQIMEAVGGTIEVESRVGRGTVFHVSVPIRNEVKQQQSSSSDEKTPQTSGDEACLKSAGRSLFYAHNSAVSLLPETEPTLTGNKNDESQFNLLVVEDNREIAAYIGSQFDSRYSVFYATNGKDGLTKALSIVPDVIITDLMMPEMDGLELCRQIRSNEIIDHIPIIVVTAKITEEERIKGLKAGADAYIAKPFNCDELRTRVEKLIDRHNRLHGKLGGNDSSVKLHASQLTDVERRFLSKVSGIIFAKLSRREEIGVPYIASELCMSDRQFYRKINAITNSTPTAYIQRVKINKAQQLLERNPQMSFGEIAYKCGFNDYSNFVRTFKSSFGVTPTQYRRSNAGKKQNS